MTRVSIVILSLCLIVAVGETAAAQTPDAVTTREMSDINWMEFKEVVPSKINTVILPTGTNDRFAGS